MSADGRHRSFQSRSLGNVLTEDKGNEEVAQNEPGRIGRLGVVRRGFQNGGFTPSALTFGANFDEENSPVPKNAKAGFKALSQAHVYFAQSDLFNPHTHSTCRPP